MATQRTNPTLQPRLVVAGAPRAIAFYVEALGAREVERYADPSGHVVHAELAIGDASFSITEEQRDWKNDAPTSLGGSPVILTLTVDDVDALGERMVRAGATIVYPIEDQFYGPREGRLRDPFGHLWIVSQEKEPLSHDEVQRRMDAWKPQG